MHHRKGRRAAPAIAGLVVMVGLLTGCAAAQHLTALTQAPKVGECWTVDFSQSQKYEDWEGMPAIPCTQKHQSYTYAVGKLTQKFTGSWLDSKGNIRTDVDQAAYDMCKAEQHRVLPTLTSADALLYRAYYVPSISLWNSGARWVRCDLAEIKVGSTIAAPVLANLPSSLSDLVSTLKTTPKKFALCENDPASNGPDGDQTTYADCTGPTDWSFVVQLALPGDTGVAYPGSAQLKKIGTADCLARINEPGHEVFAETPDKTSWDKYADRNVNCWINNN
ncbi:MAG TPA: septum formation family protein [Galbitalea sp.]|nr:septum formation family protein [Galbitalea sp.]